MTFFKHFNYQDWARFIVLDLRNSFKLVEHSHLFVYFTSSTSYYLGLFTSFTYFDFSASKIRKSDQKWLFSRIDGRQNVQQKFCMLPSVSSWRFKSTKVTSGEIMAKNGLFRILTAVNMRKKYVPKFFLTWNFQETLKVAWKV